ncbi:MAG: hypothetical protein K2W82_15680 [Candidatus Obscuribacterales bacterium]|nr:hypothetical protein [Candidatus Obscuribacterales bacterium]
MRRILPAVLSFLCIFVSLQQYVHGEETPAKTSTLTIESQEFKDYVDVIIDVRDLQKEEKELGAKCAEDSLRQKLAGDKRYEAICKFYDELESSSVAKAKDPVAAFAEAKKNKEQLDQAEQELAALNAELAGEDKQKVRERLAKVRELLKSDWISIWRMREIGEKIAKELGGVNNYSPEVEVKIRALEKAFAEKVKAKSPDNYELQVAISQYERALLDLEVAEGYARTYKAEYDKYPPYSKTIDEQNALGDKAKEILAKPADATNAAEYQKVQESMRLLEEKREAWDLASHTYHLQTDKIRQLQDEYELAFQKFVLAQ